MQIRNSWRVAAALMTTSLVSAEVLREQVIQLREGWNAVHLEVTPVASDPAQAFAGLPVDIAARYFRIESAVEFIRNPEDETWKSEDWGVWYAPGREDSFLTNLHAIQGGYCYLIHATEASQWKVTGAVSDPSIKWRNDSFNFVGFSVDSAGAPTFGDCFSGSQGKIGSRIYRLQGDQWVKVLDPANTAMRSGEAFWVHCGGQTDYQGPLELDLPGSGIVDFGKLADRKSIKWTKHLAGSLTVSVVAPKDGGPALPLNLIERDLETLTTVHHPLQSEVLTATTGGGKLNLQLRREDMAADEQSCLLKFSDSSGAVVWVPVTASRDAE